MNLKQALNIQHQNVIRRQILSHGMVTPEILSAVEKTPRSLFLPPHHSAEAFVEKVVFLDEKRTLLCPLSYVKLMQYLPQHLDADIMIVGGSTGYAAALLSYYGSTVFLLESDDTYESLAQDAFKKLGIDNIVLCQNAFRGGLERQSPFSFILIEGRVQSIPTAYFGQLEGKNSSVFAGHLDDKGETWLCRFYKNKIGAVEKEFLFKADYHPLPEFKEKEEFIF